MKPGYKTTEFWLTVVANIIAALVMLGVFTPEQQGALSDWIAALVAVLATFGYSISRGIAKHGK